MDSKPISAMGLWGTKRRARMVLTLLPAAALVMPLASGAQTTTWTINPSHSRVEFEIRHLGISNVHGRFANVTGTVLLDDKDITHSSVQATIGASTVDTKDSKRDEHLKEADFFDVAKYPVIAFRSTGLTSLNGKLQMIGNLTLAGQTRPVTLVVDGPAVPRKGTDGRFVSGFSATGDLSRKDFQFGQKYGAPLVGDNVKLTINIEMYK